MELHFHGWGSCLTGVDRQKRGLFQHQDRFTWPGLILNKGRYGTNKGRYGMHGVFQHRDQFSCLELILLAVAILLSTAIYPQRLFCCELFVIGQS